MALCSLCLVSLSSLLRGFCASVELRVNCVSTLFSAHISALCYAFILCVLSAFIPSVEYLWAFV